MKFSQRYEIKNPLPLVITFSKSFVRIKKDLYSKNQRQLFIRNEILIKINKPKISNFFQFIKQIDNSNNHKALILSTGIYELDTPECWLLRRIPK